MDTYGVVHGDVSAELPGLFPGGFTANTKPSNAQVTAQITTADTIVTLKVQSVAGPTPAVTDAAAPLAKRYVIEWVKAQVMRLSFVGNDPTAVKAATDPYDTNAATMLKAIAELGAQAEGAGLPAPRIRTADTADPRALFVNDVNLDATFDARARRF